MAPVVAAIRNTPNLRLLIHYDFYTLPFGIIDAFLFKAPISLKGERHESISGSDGNKSPRDCICSRKVPAGDDGVFVWIFLGFFALIVVGQLIPAAMLIIGLVKGITAKTKVKTEAR
jgi:hypothetical protein